MDMGLVNLSMQLSQVNAMRETRIGMIGRALDQMEQVGDQLVQMMDASSIRIPATGGIDISL
ncbi:MAG: YjfB family protein [Firmicutes bacterium]|nr:YjfB family protein [Bacillota bacterium]